MADYYPLLAKAVAGLPNSTPEARRAIYERARNALLGQLRRLDPPVPEGDVERESEALEVAVKRLEAELAPPAEPEPQPEPPQASAPESSAEPDFSSEPARAAEPPPHPDGVEEQSRKTHPAPVATATPPAPIPPKTPMVEAPVAEPGVTNPAPPKLSAATMARREGLTGAPGPRAPLFFKMQRERTLATPTLRAPSPPPSPPDEAPASQKRIENPAGNAGGGEISASPELRFRERVPEESRPTLPDARETVPEDPTPNIVGPLPVEEPPEAEQSAADRRIAPPGSRTRPDAQRPFAPQPARERAAPKRLWIVGFIVGALVLAVAVAAYELRDRPEDLRQKAATPVIAPDAAANGKIVDRVGAAAGAASTEAPPASAGTAEVSPAENTAASPAQSTPPPQPATVTSTRAALLVQAPEEQSKVKTYLGEVVWKVDNVSDGPGEPLRTAIRAEITIPEEQLKATMTFQKNFDATLAASHTMKLQFTEPQGGPLGDVKQISVPQLRREDSATGDALAGVPVPITDNSFLVGLSGGSSEASNLELIKSREWIDVPMLLSNGKIAKLTFEKGPTGQRALEDALAAWKTQ